MSFTVKSLEDVQSNINQQWIGAADCDPNYKACGVIMDYSGEVDGQSFSGPKIFGTRTDTISPDGLHVSITGTNGSDNNQQVILDRDTYNAVIADQNYGIIDVTAANLERLGKKFSLDMN